MEGPLRKRGRSGFFFPPLQKDRMFFKAEHLVTSFGFGVVVGLLASYLVQNHLDSLKFNTDTGNYQYNSLQQARHTLQQFSANNFTSSPEQGKDQCPMTSN